MNKAFQYYSSQRADMLFIQETNFLASYKPLLIHKHYLVFCSANAPNKTNGVAIC